MKKTFSLGLLSSLMFLASCSSDEVIPSTDISPNANDSVDVTLALSGDWDFSEKPLTSRVLTNSTDLYYHINISESGDPTTRQIGFFDDMQCAKLRLRRGTTYWIKATALKGVDINDYDFSKLILSRRHENPKYVDIYNKFAALNIQGYEYVGDAVDLPNFENKRLEHYFGFKEFSVSSNETVCVDLLSYFYKLSFELTPPITGYLKVSCEDPFFTDSISTNDQEQIVSRIFALNRFDDTKNIIVKKEYFDSNNKSINVSTKEFLIKRNTEASIKVINDLTVGDNNIKVELDSIPMKKEENVF